MPVAQQASHQHHHHLFSAIGTFLHARHPSNSNSNNNLNSSSGFAEVSAGHGGASDVPLLYQAFESHLTQRLSSLLPTDDPSCFSLFSFNEYMGLLLATQTDLRLLIPASHAQRRSMNEFLERSIKVLDVCRDIKEQIADVESLQGMLRIVAPCLISKHGISIHQGKINRARKIFAKLLLQIGVENEDDAHQQQHVEMHQSFRGRLRERLSGHSWEGSPQRWRSGHGHQDSITAQSHGNSSPSFHLSASSLSGAHGHSPSLHASHGSLNSHAHASDVLRALQALELSLLPPKLVTRDEEDCFAAAIYALNALSVFFLGTITAAFPSLGIKAHVIAAIHPPSSFGWTDAFLRLQDMVQEELKVRSKRRVVHAGMSELNVLFSIIKSLLELTSPECLPLSAGNEEEIIRLASQFDSNVRELERDLADFNDQITVFYNQIISARLEVLDLISNATG